MKKNNSQPQFKGLNILNISGVSPLNTNATTVSKKIQGYDLTSTMKNNSFTNKI